MGGWGSLPLAVRCQLPLLCDTGCTVLLLELPNPWPTRSLLHMLPTPWPVNPLPLLLHFQCIFVAEKNLTNLSFWSRLLHPLPHIQYLMLLDIYSRTFHCSCRIFLLFLLLSTLNNIVRRFLWVEKGGWGECYLGGGVWTPLFGGGRTQFSVRVES